MKNLSIEANKKVVKALMDKLIEAFEEFANTNEKGLEYVDSLMGCHNFYKRIILDLEERTGKTGIIKTTAVNTLAECFGMKVK